MSITAACTIRFQFSVSRNTVACTIGFWFLHWRNSQSTAFLQLLAFAYLMATVMVRTKLWQYVDGWRLELNKASILIGSLGEFGESSFPSSRLPWRMVELKWTNKVVLLLIVIDMNWRWNCADGNRPVCLHSRLQRVNTVTIVQVTVITQENCHIREVPIDFENSH
jgi:hypothetical protein